jgi:site-specific DNA-methyltransferase (adenine-specific)
MTKFWLSQLDAVEYLKTLPDASIDMVCTDVPYESLEKHRKVGTTTRLKHSKGSSNDWFDVFPNARFAELFAEFYRVLKRNAHCYFYCDWETKFIAKPIGEAAGFKLRKPLVWHKKSIGMGYGYRAQHENILYFEKGKRRLNDLGIGDVLEFPRIKGKDAYPTEKPVALNEVLVTQSTQPGEIVLDPFMGSGSAGVAAIKNGRCFLGNDIDPKSFLHTRKRLLEIGGVESEPSITASISYGAGL